MSTIKLKFLSIFDEDKNETLRLKKDIKVQGESHKKDEEFRKGEKIEGVDFHLLRYFDLVGEMEGEIFHIKGVIPQK